MVLTLLAPATTVSQAAPGYTYNGTSNLIGSWLVGTIAHTSPVVGAEVGAEVGLVVGAEVGADVGLVVGADVGADVGLVVGAEVGADVGLVVGADDGAEVGFVVGAVDGAEVGRVVGADDGVDVGLVVGADDGEDVGAPFDPPYDDPVSITWPGVMLFTETVITLPLLEVRRKVKGVVNPLPEGEEYV